MADIIENTSDVLDVRDIIARFEELRDSRNEAWAEGKHVEESWAETFGDEFESLKSLLEDLKGNGGDEQWQGDWYPISLIHENYFTDYCEDFVKDCYGFPNDIPSFVVIDWERTAENLKSDYSEVDFDGQTYYYN